MSRCCVAVSARPRSWRRSLSICWPCSRLEIRALEQAFVVLTAVTGLLTAGYAASLRRGVRRPECDIYVRLPAGDRKPVSRRGNMPVRSENQKSFLTERVWAPATVLMRALPVWSADGTSIFAATLPARKYVPKPVRDVPS